MHRFPLLCVLSLLLLPQDPKGEAAPSAQASRDRDLEAFLAELPGKLRRKDAPAAVPAYEAKATFRTYADGNTVDVQARILFEAPGSLREEIEDGKKSFARGILERTGKDGSLERQLWMQEGGRSWPLSGREYAEDRRALRRDRNLAALTARYLYPERELARLDRLSGPEAMKLRIPSRDGPPVDKAVVRVQGIAKHPGDYPLVLTEDHDGPIQVSVLFDAATLEPMRIRLQPLDGKTLKPLPFREEGVDFSGFADFDGLRLPHQLTFVHADPKGKDVRLRVGSRVTILEFRVLSANFPDGTFRKPKTG